MGEDHAQDNPNRRFALGGNVLESVGETLISVLINTCAETGPMKNPLVMRAAFVNATVSFYRSLGTPVERELAHAGLPSEIAEMPNAYVSARLVTKFRNRCRGLEKIPDTGWHIYGSYHLRMLNARFAKVADQAVTVHDRLKRLLETVPMESSFVRCVLKPTADGVDVIYNRPPDIEFDHEPALWEWNRALAIVTLVQSGAGTSWRPRKIGFTARFQPCHEALEYCGNTRLLFGQPQMSISIPSHILALPVGRSDLELSAHSHGDPAESPNGEARELFYLRSALKAYLPDRGKPSLELAAEIAGMSKRNFQRCLSRSGLTFSELLHQCRYQVAAGLLADPQIKIIDVAMAVGYQNPGNFTRAFQRISGVPPRSFRKILMRRQNNFPYIHSS